MLVGDKSCWEEINAKERDIIQHNLVSLSGNTIYYTYLIIAYKSTKSEVTIFPCFVKNTFSRLIHTNFRELVLDGLDESS
jgi:hypothetical protein